MTRKSTCSKEVGTTSKSVIFYSQGQRASNIENHAPKHKDEVKDLVVPRNPAAIASQAKLNGSMSHAQSAKDKASA